MKVAGTTLSFLSRLLAVALACLALIGAGCTPKPAPSGEKKPVEIRFWYAWGGYEGKFLASLVDEFNRTHPHIRVKASFFNIGDKLLASIAGGTPPHVATVWDFMLGTLGESGCFLPLEDRLTSAGITRADYLPNIWEYGLYGKHRWGVPTTLNALAIFYNTRLLREAGIDPARPPRSVAELTEYANRLTKRDPSGRLTQLGLSPIATPIWWWNFGGDYFDMKAKRFTLDRPENIRAMEWMTSLYANVGMDNVRRFAAGFGKLDSPQHPLVLGKLGLREDGQWFTQIVAKYSPGFDYGVWAYPPEKAGQPAYTRTDGSFWCMPRGAGNPDEAWEFLEWLIAPAQNARFCAELRNIPPRRAAVEHPAFAPTRKDPRFEFFVREVVAGHGRVMPALPVGQQFNEAIEQGQETVFSGRVTPREFLTDLQRRMNKEMERAETLMGVGEEN